MAITKVELLEWAVGRYMEEVRDRPLKNRHRRTLDDTWRQVIRRLEPKTEALLGLTHDELLAAERETLNGAVPRYKEAVSLHHILTHNLHEDNDWIIKEAAAHGHSVDNDLVEAYRQLNKLRQIEDMTPKFDLKVGATVTVHQGKFSQHGELIGKFWGCTGEPLAVVAHEGLTGFAYNVYAPESLTRNTGKTLMQKADSFDKLCGMQGRFDLTYDHWEVQIPLPESVRDIKDLEDLMDKLKEADD